MNLSQRDIEKQRMLHFIYRQSAKELSPNAQKLYEALATCLAKAPAQLFTIQIDDLDEQVLPVNILTIKNTQIGGVYCHVRQSILSILKHHC